MKTPETPPENPNAEQLVKYFQSHSVRSLCQSELPHPSHILGVGKSIVKLGDEVTSYLADVAWTNVAPEYDEDPSNPYQPNLEIVEMDIENIPNIYPENHFDRIYAYAPDFADIEIEQRKALFSTVLKTLKYGKYVEIAASMDTRLFDDAYYVSYLGRIQYRKRQ